MFASARIAAVVLIAPALLIGAALLAGCSNSPESLRFELTADPAVVPAGGPVVLTVRLASTDKTIGVCRPTPGALDIAVTRLDCSTADRERMRDRSSSDSGIWYVHTTPGKRRSWGH